MFFGRNPFTDGGGCMAKSDMTYRKAFIGALFLTRWNLANSQLVVKDEATVDVLCGICIFASDGNKHIRRGLLRCSFNY